MLFRSTIEKNHLQFAAKVMAKAKKRSAQHGILFNDHIEYGNEEKQIISYSTKNKFDLIVIGSRGMGAVKQFFMGSTSSYVIHKSQIPVLIVK